MSVTKKREIKMLQAKTGIRTLRGEIGIIRPTPVWIGIDEETGEKRVAMSRELLDKSFDYKW